MATGLMPAIIALLCLGCGAATAAEVALIGVIGDKAAVLALDGGDPKTVKVGQTWNGITVLSVAPDRATVQLEAGTRVLQYGQHYRSGAVSSNREKVTLSADSRGMFYADGAVNGVAVRFIVDTGATFVSLSARDATRLGLDFRKGRPVMMQTANGSVMKYRVTLDRVRLGDIELAAVDGVVGGEDMPFALLGMSFLNRLELQREGMLMTLTRRF